jgi:thiamine pyrophosphokinase
VGATDTPDPGNAGGGSQAPNQRTISHPHRGGFFVLGKLMTRIVVFANGELNQPHALKRHLRPTDRIFCADGGTVNALSLGLTPEKIIGDLDSVPPEVAARLEAAGVVIHRYPRHKDQTALELALDWARREEPAEIMLVTALGGRLDQMLANILLLTRPEFAPIRMTLADGPQWASLLRAHQRLTVTGQPGEIISLVPLTPIVTAVNFEGVGWPLHHATLEFGSTFSISNALAGPQATVSIGEGMVLVIHLASGG